MALPGVSITLTNGALGLVAPGEDGVVGIIFNGTAPSGLSLGESLQGFSIEDFEAAGITQAYDTDEEVKVWGHIKEFYDEAGDGAELWVMIVSQATNIQTMLDKTTTNAKKLLDDAGGRIRILGVGRNPASGYSPNTAANQIDVDVVNAFTTGQALADDMQAAFTPVRFVLPAYAFTGTTSTLANLKTQTKPNIAVLMGDTNDGAGAAIGLLLGRLASVPVQRNPGRVKDGSLLITEAFIGGEAFEDVPTAAIAIHDKGFITFRKHPGKAGYYFSDDPTAVAATDDYSSLARCRVIDKAIRIAAETFTNELLDEVLIDSNGRIATVKAKYYQSIIENAVNTAMTAEGEISAFESFVDDQQNVLSTNKICVELRITPVGYAKQIEIQLGFNNPAN